MFGPDHSHRCSLRRLKAYWRSTVLYFVLPPQPTTSQRQHNSYHCNVKMLLSSLTILPVLLFRHANPPCQVSLGGRLRHLQRRSETRQLQVSLRLPLVICRRGCTGCMPKARLSKIARFAVSNSQCYYGVKAHPRLVTSHRWILLQSGRIVALVLQVVEAVLCPRPGC